MLLNQKEKQAQEKKDFIEKYLFTWLLTPIWKNQVKQGFPRIQEITTL
mgnify:CR=1 FL=1